MQFIPRFGILIIGPCEEQVGPGSQFERQFYRIVAKSPFVQRDHLPQARFGPVYIGRVQFPAGMVVGISLDDQPGRPCGVFRSGSARTGNFMDILKRGKEVYVGHDPDLHRRRCSEIIRKFVHVAGGQPCQRKAYRQVQ